MKKRLFITSLILSLLTAFSMTVFAQEFSYDKEGVAKGFKKPGYSPYAGRNFPTQVYWGDTHLHTGLSGDAFGFGNQLTDEDAFRFAAPDHFDVNCTASHGATIWYSIAAPGLVWGIPDCF